MNISFAIPFLASKYTKAFELCIKSIIKYCPYEFDFYIQIDKSDDNLAKNLNLDNITKLFPKITIKEIIHKSSGSYKNELIQWVTRNSNSDIVIVLHSDVIFFCDTAFKKIVEPLVTDKTKIASYWKIPFVEYCSTFHNDITKKKNFFVAPRVSSWIFGLNRKVFLNQIEDNKKFEECFNGHFWIKNGDCNLVSADYLNWLTKQQNYSEYYKSNLNCLIDIGCIFLYLIDKYSLSATEIGVETNPSMSSLKFKLRTEGYIHVEQYDPQRFDGSLYENDLFELRTKMLETIESKDFSIEECKDVFL